MVQRTGLLFPDKIKCIFFLWKSFFLKKCITFALIIHKKKAQMKYIHFAYPFYFYFYFKK